MYGKHFEKMYTGSLVGKGAITFAVMGYVIANQKPPDFNVELNSTLLSAIFGEPESEVEKAIEFLCGPDPRSRTETKEGRRLEKIGSFLYHVINGEVYHQIRNEDERRAYIREKVQEFRTKKKKESQPISTQKPPQNPAPPTVEKLTKNKTQIDDLPAPLKSDSFLVSWEAWKKHRSEKKKPITPSTSDKQLTMLAGWGEIRAIAALGWSIQNGWTGIFEPQPGQYQNGSAPVEVSSQERQPGETEDQFVRRIST